VRTEPRPPLTKRLRPGHLLTLDVALAAVLAIILTGVFFRAAGMSSFLAGDWYARMGTAALLATATCLPVALRRRQPVTALAAVLALSVLTSMLYSVPAQPSFMAVALVLYVVAATQRRKVSATALAAVLGLLTVENVVPARGGPIGGVIPVDLFVCIVWTIGYAARQRRSYAARLQQQAASSAVTEERLRIARELHDVVAHSMTVVAVQASFGHHVIDTQPAQARAALGAIQATSREALTEMQRLLGVLRQADPGAAGPAAQPSDGNGDTAGGRARGAAATPDPGAAAGDALGDAGARDRGRAGEEAPGPPLLPAPGLADLDRLVARTADAGVRVSLWRKGRCRDIPAGIDLSAYRIVQEALTNVVKHAGPTTCEVTIDYADGHLCIDVADDGPGGNGMTPGAARGAAALPGWQPAGTGLAGHGGHGLIGMRERVNLYHGEFSAAPRPGQGFRVTARLPLTEGAR
jgi:signal transduction histidine kinase